jgi:hypothetical protein
MERPNNPSEAMVEGHLDAIIFVKKQVLVVLVL